VQNTHFQLTRPEYEHVLPELKALEGRDMHVKITLGARFMYVELTKTTKQYEAHIKQWKTRRDRAREKLSKFGNSEGALVYVLKEKYKEVVEMRCVRLEPKGRVPRTVLDTPPVLERKKHAPEKAKDQTSQHEQVNRISGTPQRPGTKDRVESHTKDDAKDGTKSQTSAPQSNIAAFAQQLLQQQPKKKPQAPHAEPSADASSSKSKRKLDEGDTTGSVRSKPPKRSKKRMALEDACALFGM
jgi:hypothetical protein